MSIDRRTLIKEAPGAAMVTAKALAASQDNDQARWSSTWTAALPTLADTVRVPPRFDAPVLFHHGARRLGRAPHMRRR